MVELNPRIGVFILLFFALYIVFFQSWLIFAPANMLFHKPPSAIINNAATIIYKDKIVLVTPTPDGHTYFAGEYQNGTRLLKRPFTVLRYNALFKQDMKVTTIIYDYMYFEKLHWYNPSMAKYYVMAPCNGDGDSNYTECDKKFLLVFVYMFMDNIGGDDTRMWQISRNQFGVLDGFNVTYPLEYAYQLRFRELENTHNFNNDMFVQGFNSMRQYSKSATFKSVAGEYNDEIFYLRGGQSNAIDGFLLFEVNKNSTVENTIALMNFHAMGYSSWRLKA